MQSSANGNLGLLAPCIQKNARCTCTCGHLSPLAVLQRGDAFDLATVLVSLLLGAGYNAFVVMGYAPLAVALNDQSADPCPYISMDARESPGECSYAGPAAEDWDRTGAVTGAGAGGLSRAAAGGETSSSTKHQPQQDPAGAGPPNSAARSPRIAATLGAGAGDRARRPAAEAALENNAPLRALAGTAAWGAAGSASASANTAQSAKLAGVSSSREAPGGAGFNAAPSSGVGIARAERPSRLSKLVHAWVLVLPGKREVTPAYPSPPQAHCPRRSCHSGCAAYGMRLNHIVMELWLLSRAASTSCV